MEIATIYYLGHRENRLHKYEVLGTEKDAKLILVYAEHQLNEFGKVWLRVDEINIDETYEREFGVSGSLLYSYRQSSRPSKDSLYARSLCEKYQKSL